MALDTASGTKVCAICHEPKPLSAFHKRTRSRDGLQAHCKGCGRQMLDAADARRAARAQHARVIADREELADRLTDRIEAVVDLLFDVADEGDPDVLYCLADLLCGPECPEADDAYTGAACLPHLLACVHYNTRLEREASAPR
jgi:hypothetical protein